MPLNNQAKSVLEQRAAANMPATDTISPAQARVNSRLRPPLIGPNVAKEEDKLVTGSDGKLTARIFTPAGNGPFPVLVWFHGGGWVIGDLDRSDGVCSPLTIDSLQRQNSQDLLKIATRQQNGYMKMRYH